MGTPPHGRRKVSVLAADQARPVLDYKPLEGIVKESEFAARKNAKQVAVKVPKDLTEVQSSQIGDVWREHVPQYFAQRPRPVSQHRDRAPVNLSCDRQVGRSKGALFPAQLFLFTTGTSKKSEP
jgi:hypothetical protein